MSCESFRGCCCPFLRHVEQTDQNPRVVPVSMRRLIVPDSPIRTDRKIKELVIEME